MQLAFPFLFAEPAYQISVSRFFLFLRKTWAHWITKLISICTTKRVNKYSRSTIYNDKLNSQSICPPSPSVLLVNHRNKRAFMSQHLIILQANTFLKGKCKYAYYIMKTRASSGSTGRKIQFQLEVFFSPNVDIFSLSSL